jgi:hypothetical protein
MVSTIYLTNFLVNGIEDYFDLKLEKDYPKIKAIYDQMPADI